MKSRMIGATILGILCGAAIALVVSQLVLEQHLIALTREQVATTDDLQNTLLAARQVSDHQAARAAELEARVSDLEERFARMALPSASQILERVTLNKERSDANDAHVPLLGHRLSQR